MAEKSKVYFADFRAPSWRENLPQKLARLMMTAGFGDIDMDGKYVAIKMHFGEPGNLAYLRPNWARAVVDLVKSHGGKPFLTDCNTLYVGGRKNALDHIESAYINGFTPYSTGCHILIADGLKGNDEVEDIFAQTLKEQGFTASAPYNGEQWGIGAEGAVCIKEGNRVHIEHRLGESASRAATVFQRLVSAGKRLLRVIEHNEGGANKDLAKFADQINALCDKWDR